MEYEIVDALPRQGQFDFYAEHPRPFYAVTWSVAITGLRSWAERNHVSIHLTLCYFMARAMASVEDFRYRLIDGEVRLYDRLHVGSTLPTPDGQFAFGFFEYHDDVKEFMRGAEAERARLRLDGVLRTDTDRPNMVLCTALPNVPFSAMTHVPLPDPADARPNVGFGRFAAAGGELTVPISVQVNHRYIGGRALGELVDAVEQAYGAPA